MSDLGLTKEEREYVERAARDQHSARSRLGFYACMVVPMLAFAVYGFVKRDFVAEFIAFLGLLLFLWWRTSQEMQGLETYKSLCRKIVQHERDNSGA